MANQIDRDAFVKRDVLKNPIPYTRGTDLLPIVIHFRDFQIPSGATARVFVAKPDGNAVYTTATIDGNDVTVDVTDQMFIELGTALMQISIMDGEEELVSFVQPVDVQQNLKAGDLPASTTDVKFLDEAIEQANEAVNTATTAAKQAATAVQNANQAIEDANDAISDLNAQIASLNTNFASLANNVSISQLDTTAKTLVGAIDELNSKSYLLQGGTAIPSDADMNDYTEIGNYYCNANSIAQTLENCPTTSGFTLKVENAVGKSSAGSSGYIRQTFTEYDTGRKIVRYRVNSTGTWQPFVYFSDDATIFGGTAIKSGDDLNDYTTPGIYRSASSNITATLLNMPEIFVSGFSLLVLPISTDANVQVIYMGGAGGRLYIRSATSSGWKSWYKLEGTVISS